MSAAQEQAIARLVELLGKHAKHDDGFHVAVSLGDVRTVLAALQQAQAPVCTMELAETPIDADCWRDCLSVRTINALTNRYSPGPSPRGFGVLAPKAGDVLILPELELLQVKNLGSKGVEQIRVARARLAPSAVAS